VKRLIICSDGTWNKPDQKDRGERHPSNVTKIARAIKPETPQNIAQVVYYQIGIGTGFGLDKYLGGGTGLGLSNNIIQCYQFLSHNYVPGDEIYLFGFSRGAYTVRSLAGLISKVGLLPKDEIFFMREAYSLYRNRNENADDFKNKHKSQDAKIRFIGVWDTVGALGIPVGFLKGITNKKYQFHDVKLSSNIEHGYHALAVDEKRKAFEPTLWDPEANLGERVEQRWFIGSHTNVGGGFEKDGLANIPLHWLKGKAFKLGLEFDDNFLGYYRPYELDEIRESWTGKIPLIGRVLRKIHFTKNGNEIIDISVNKRIETNPEYKPKNIT